MRATTHKRDANMAGMEIPRQESDKRPKITTSGRIEHTTTEYATVTEESDIMKLLDLHNGDTVTAESVEARFASIAQSLMHEHRIVWRDAANSAREEYDIVELEFYLNSTEHADPYTHGAEEQTTLGHWYFHRAPRKTPTLKPKVGSKPAGYRGGTRKGLDITLGCPPGLSNEVMRGGILLRTVRRVSDQHIISGPSLLVDEILRVSSAASLIDRVENHWLRDISICSHSPKAKSWLSLMRKEGSNTSGIIYNSPRIGLDLSHPSAKVEKENPRLRFVCALYRFFMHPELLIANGRGQTFLGVVLGAPKAFACSAEELVLKMPKRVGLQPATAAKYLATYRAARETGDVHHFIGSPGKGAGSSAIPFLQMVGAIRRYLDLEEPAKI